MELPMNDGANNTSKQQPSVGGSGCSVATASLVLGVISLFGIITIPIFGTVLALAGIALGYLGIKDPPEKNLATVGMIISILGILLSCVPLILLGQ